MPTRKKNPPVPAFPPQLFQLDEMTRSERVAAAVRGEEVDRIPVCFWHHFKPAGSGRRLADASIKFFDETFDLDIIKIMPDIEYPFPRASISKPEDWLLIEPLSYIQSRFFQQRAEAVHAVRESLLFDTPVIMTVFSPLCEALRFAQSVDQFKTLMREHPARVHEALAVIAENLREQNRFMLGNGADGIFFALQGCMKSVMTEDEYREFGRPYDLIALQGAQSGWLNILHIHGDKDIYFDLMLDYPVDVFSWSDRMAGPSLKEARTRTSKCLMGGWHEFGAISKGPAAKIREQAQDAVNQLGGRGFILANGCSVPDETDEKWLHIARDAANELDWED